jgi:YHS domain-containing protein/thiol-disulfide isomerase/thioredoxin
MQVRRWLLPTVLLLLPLWSTVRAEDGPYWQPSIDAAKRIAAQSNRLVLIHFWARWCGPCRNLEANVFKQPGVGAAMEARFVLAKVNVDVDDGHALAHSYGIERLPTDVIITPTNRVLAKLACPDNPAQYLAQLDQAAAAAGQLGAGPPNMVAQSAGNSAPLIQNPYRAPVAAGPNAMGAPPGAMPPGSAPPPAYGSMAVAPAIAGPGMPGAGVGSPNMNGSGPMAGPPAFPTADNAMAGPGMRGSAPPPALTDNWSGLRDPNAPPNNNPPHVAGVGPPQGPPPGASQSMMMAGFRPVVAAAPPEKPIGLEGFCPVTLVERSRSAPQDPRCWIPGDARWGAVHRGMTYLFAGPEEQKKFLADPDRYSPVLSGNDPVLAFDRAQLQMGRREFGTFYDNRIYLFTSNESLEKFRQNARRYAEEVRQAEANNHGDIR